MFKNPTTIILGAGASWHYGFPTGEALINDIIADIDEFRPYLECGQTQFNSKLNNEDINYLKNNNFFNESYTKLSDDLKSFSPLVIDYFLSQFKEHEKVGKEMIAYEILKREKEISKYYGHRNADEKGEGLSDKEDDGNWYKYLSNAIISNCRTHEDLLESIENLTIITFNYDVSLEYYLYNTIAKNPFFTDTDKNINYGLNHLKELNIHHVYGALYKFDWQEEGGVPNDEYGQHLDSDAYNDWLEVLADHDNISYKINAKFADTRNTFNSFVKKFSKNIKVIAPNKMEEDSVRKLMEPFREKIKQSENIFMLGFGCDLSNTDLLFYDYEEIVQPNIVCEIENGKGRMSKKHIFSQKEQYQTLVEGSYNENSIKTIFYTNYGNSLKISKAVSTIICDSSKCMNELQNKNIFTAPIIKLGIDRGSESNFLSASSLFGPTTKTYSFKCIKSTKSVYDALAHDFDFL